MDLKLTVTETLEGIAKRIREIGESYVASAKHHLQEEAKQIAVTQGVSDPIARWGSVFDLREAAAPTRVEATISGSTGMAGHDWRHVQIFRETVHDYGHDDKTLVVRTGPRLEPGQYLLVVELRKIGPA